MGGKKGDREIRERVLREFERDWRLAGLRIEVIEGRVTLAGTVDSYAKKLAARDAAHCAAGTPELTDHIQVRLPGATERTDRELAAAVGRALEFDEFVPDRKIRFTVARGEVLLDGEVETLAEREDAARVVRHLTGVTAIVNQIKVKNDTTRRRPRPNIETRT